MPRSLAHNDTTLLISPRASEIAHGDFLCCHALQCLQALKKSHDGNLVHRDFRPANIMIYPGDRILVNDWGFAVEEGKVIPYAGAEVYASDKVAWQTSECGKPSSQ